jgi:hypothetical protein
MVFVIFIKKKDIKGHKRLKKQDLKPNFASETSSYASLSDRKISSSEKAMAVTVFYEEGQYFFGLQRPLGSE